MLIPLNFHGFCVAQALILKQRFVLQSYEFQSLAEENLHPNPGDV